MTTKVIFGCLLLLSSGQLCAQTPPPAAANYAAQHYTKQEVYVTMRDGVKLFTAIYTPKGAGAKQKYPILMQRTCYSVAPYGPGSYPARLGPSETMMKQGYIFVYQDVRGRWKSQGTFTNMTPIIDKKKGKTAVDEGSDTYDTIDWLVKKVASNNGRVGQWGISYPGFYTAAGILSNHPALKASSPQAPVSDFFFDDFHHNGAFLESYLFTFPVFGVQKTDTTSKAWYGEQMIKAGTRDGYQFLLDMGPLKNADKYYSKNFFWQETIDHPSYDDFWQKRALPPHYAAGVKPAVMTVGGWFDAEDLRGPLTIYKTIEKKSPGTYNTLVMGPFGHGRWSRETGHTMHSNVYFGDSIATFYQRNIEAKFFEHFLKGSGDKNSGLPEAYLFDTGNKQWETFEKWPAAAATHQKLYLSANGKLDQQAAAPGTMSFVSDPLKPVPYTEDNTTTMGFTPHNYMSEDQRFAGRRPDVLVYQTDVLTDDVTLGGEIMANLKVASTSTDADWVVKLIDVYPADEKDNDYRPNKNIILSNYWQMVRSEVMPARFRNSFEKPEALVANQKTDVNFRLQDVLHTFKKGHRIMVQVQSTWFPFIARNPQTFVPNPYKASESDYVKATHSVYSDSFLDVEVLPAGK